MPNKRFRLVGAVALIALAGFLQTTAGRACGVYCNSEFHKYFEGLGNAEARVNPVERVLFSVLLTATPHRPQAQGVRLQAVTAKPL
jgi:hypothetical protein